MKQTFLKGLHLLGGRAKVPAAALLKETTQRIREAAPGQLCSLFAEAVEPEKIQGALGARKRLYTPASTFWLMLGQVIRGGSLRSAARELQAFSAAMGLISSAPISHGHALDATLVTEPNLSLFVE